MMSMTTEGDGSDGVESRSSEPSALLEPSRVPGPADAPETESALPTSDSAPLAALVPPHSQLEKPTSPSHAPAVNLPEDTVKPSPAPRRPKPPTRGILKPPPPPPKPTLGNRLRDIVSNSVTIVGGSAKSLFDPAFETDSPGAGPSSRPAGSVPTPPQSMTAAVGGTLNALSGRLGLGFSRLVAGSPTASPSGTPTGSPMPVRFISLPDTGSTPMPMSEKSRQKQPLRRATFLLPNLSIIYPISSQGEPWSEKVLEDRKRIESMHRSLMSTTTGAEYWTSARLVTLYDNACRIREEQPRTGIRRALERLPLHPQSRHLHLYSKDLDSHQPHTAPSYFVSPLERHSGVEALADVLTAEWGLQELKLENGILEGDDALKPILHALLVSGTLSTLSLQGNKKIRAGGWRLLAVFLKRAQSLKYLDLSDTSWDRKGVDCLVQALNCAPIRSTSSVGLSKRSNGHHPSSDPKDLLDQPLDEKDENLISDGVLEDYYGSFILPAPLLKDGENDGGAAAVQTLRMDGCGLKANVLESLAQGVRTSDVKNISLRRNRIGPLGAVALALMIRDFPDAALSTTTLSPSLATAPNIHNATLPGSDRATSPIPYAARTRRPRISNESNDSPLPHIPLVISSSTGGITSRSLPNGHVASQPSRNHPNKRTQNVPTIRGGPSPDASPTEAEGRAASSDNGVASIALARSVRALDRVERIGRLWTLDIKSNEIKNGVGYIAQVLKRNRTLRVLNLSDNRIEAPGLAALAEALKYNSSLATLDMSFNPCCGPTLDGISALRTTFTVNTSLKRLFLSDTNLTTESAIALAEFLPETNSLLHLDLTSNPQVDTAGVLAISVGLKSNTSIRCLDISIQPNNAELAELSQNILQACIRNTEIAASNLKTGRLEAIWAPIKKSALVRDVKEADKARAEQERLDMAQSPEGLVREYVYTLKPEEVIEVSRQTVSDLKLWFEAGRLTRNNGFYPWESGQLPKEDFHPLVDRARVLRERIVDQIQETTDDDKLPQLLTLYEELGTLILAPKTFKPPPRLLLPSQNFAPETPNPANNTATNTSRALHPRRHMRVPSHEISSPNFSIGESDNDSDAEELDVGKLPHTGTGNAGLGLDAEVVNETLTSPVEKASRAWMQEEGEIFRKGTRLGVAEEDEVDENGDMPGELLKQEILDTEVARSPVRRLIAIEDGEEESVRKDIEEAVSSET